MERLDREDLGRAGLGRQGGFGIFGGPAALYFIFLFSDDLLVHVKST